ncbi:MAG TPA: MTH938/NDUFAF3 family protein, partial [Casimicrobiaceae bacterium]|nr:MTH938/NDUFAF3 family protein [Casimicrobiaceae bacterium]
MKFHLQTPAANLITGVGAGWIRIGQQEYRENVVLTAEGVRTGFAPDGFDALTREDFAQLASDAPDVVLLGTGSSQRFPHPRLTQDLLAAHVGLEVMDTRAACR